MSESTMEKELSTVAVIPAFNVEKMIAKVILVAQKYVDKVVVCDDGSVDMTGEIARRVGADVIRHEQNLGYGKAIQSLFHRARELHPNVTVTLDGDGQHDPSDIPFLVKPILEGKADIVIGSRFLEGARPAEIPGYRRAGIKAIARLIRASSNHVIEDAQSGLRAYSRKAIESLRLSETGMGISAEILFSADKQHLRVMEVPASCRYKSLQTSTHGPVRHGVSVVMSILKLVVEDRPLLFLGGPGVISLVAGLFFGIWMLRLYDLERRIVTNIALASIAFTLIGLFTITTAMTLYAITRLLQKAIETK